MNKQNFYKRIHAFDTNWKDLSWERLWYPWLKLGSWVTVILFLPLIFLISYFEESN